MASEYSLSANSYHNIEEYNSSGDSSGMYRDGYVAPRSVGSVFTEWGSAAVPLFAPCKGGNIPGILIPPAIDDHHPFGPGNKYVTAELRALQVAVHGTSVTTSIWKKHIYLLSSNFDPVDRITDTGCTIEIERFE